MYNAWLVSGTTTVANFTVRDNIVVVPETLSWRDLEERWKRLTLTAVDSEIMDARERVKLKRGATEDDRVIAVMGPDVYKRKKEAMAAKPSFVLYADDPKIIDIDSFSNLDKVILV